MPAEVKNKFETGAEQEFLLRWRGGGGGGGGHIVKHSSLLFGSARSVVNWSAVCSKDSTKTVFFSSLRAPHSRYVRKGLGFSSGKRSTSAIVQAA